MAIVSVLLTSWAGQVPAQPPPEVGAVAPPEVVKRVEAVYPASALPGGLRGEVVLALTVAADGAVQEPQVVSGVAPDLDAAALAALEQWVFRPARRGDTAVPSRIRVAFKFEPPVPAAAGAVPAPTPPPPPPAPEPAPPPPTEPPKEAVMDVTVLGRRQPPSRGTADFDLRIEELARVPRKNAAELLQLAPGILLTNEGGEGHAEQVFLRGFDAREGQDIEFSVGGVPINESGNLHGNGYADTHFIIPELVESLRVLEGPFDPRQGNYAVAGSANYELGLAERGLSASYTTGSWATQRLLLLWGPEEASRHTFGGVELFRSDGFGQNRDSERGAAMAQYEGHLGSRGTFRLFGSAYATSYHSAGVLRDDDYQAGRKGFYDTYDFDQGGDSSRFGLAADLDEHAGATSYYQQVFLTQRGMRLREDFTGFLLDQQELLQRPHPQRGDLLDLDTQEVTLGARGSARRRFEVRHVPQELELGYFARVDWVAGSQQRIEHATGFPYATDTELDSKLTDVGGYLDADLRPLRLVSLRGGVRADAFTFDVDNLCAVTSVSHPSAANPPGDGSCLDQANFGRHREPNQRSTTGTIAVLPRVALMLGPVRGLTLSGSYGLGVRSVDPIYVSQDIKTPFASVKASEAGLAYTLDTDRLVLVARTAVFRTHVDKDLIFSEVAGRNVLGVGTTRLGGIAALRLTGRFFDESVNATLVRSTFDDTHDLVAYVPDLVVRSDTALFHDLPRLRVAGAPVRGSLGVGITYVGRRALPFGERSDTMFVVDGQARLRWKWFEAGLAATNLFDRRYRLGEFNFASDFRLDPSATPSLVPVRHFTAGPPRGLFLTVGLSTGGM